jgi:mannose-6-phosphate isomerase-like protein (cupin superfamily)
MIKKLNERKSETRENMRDGSGVVTIRHYFQKEEINSPCRLCAELILPPGSGIGSHGHDNEDEVFIVQQGQGIITDNGEEVNVYKGDAILTGNGGSHAIRNTSDIDLVVTAVIVQY